MMIIRKSNMAKDASAVYGIMEKGSTNAHYHFFNSSWDYDGLNPKFKTQFDYKNRRVEKYPYNVVGFEIMVKDDGTGTIFIYCKIPYLATHSSLNKINYAELGYFANIHVMIENREDFENNRESWKNVELETSFEDIADIIDDPYLEDEYTNFRDIIMDLFARDTSYSSMNEVFEAVPFKE